MQRVCSAMSHPFYLFLQQRMLFVEHVVPRLFEAPVSQIKRLPDRQTDGFRLKRTREETVQYYLNGPYSNKSYGDLFINTAITLRTRIRHYNRVAKRRPESKHNKTVYNVAFCLFADVPHLQ